MKKSIIIAAAVIVCIAVALSVYFVWFRNKPAKNEAASSTLNGAGQFESVTNGETKNTNGSIVGVWAGEGDADFFYSFNSNKTGSFTMGGEVKNFTYKDNGDTVVIVFEGNSKEHEYKYTVENNVLSIENDYGAIEKYNWK